MNKTYTINHLAGAIVISVVSILALRGIIISGSNSLLNSAARYGQDTLVNVICSYHAAGTIAATTSPVVANCPDGTKRGIITVTLGK